MSAAAHTNTVQTLSLRDYFAAQALTSPLAKQHDLLDSEALAAWAYRVADAMLEARDPQRRGGRA